jgi:hypothetical protein
VERLLGAGGGWQFVDERMDFVCDVIADAARRRVVDPLLGSPRLAMHAV